MRTAPSNAGSCQRKAKDESETATGCTANTARFLMMASAKKGRISNTMFQGLRTVIYHVEDLEQAKSWYRNVLGFAPYFDEPFYVGFTVGGFELGLDPDMSGVSHGTNEVAYWGTDNAAEEVRRLVALGATSYREVQEVGGGIRVGMVKDPFGNVIGIIENPHFKITNA